MGGSSIFPPTKDVPRGVGRRELSWTAWCEGEGHDRSPEPPLLLLRKRLPNELPVVLETLAPFRPRLKAVAVESTCNWCWLVDGLMEEESPVVLAHPSEMDQYDGIKEADDLTDAWRG